MRRQINLFNPALLPQKLVLPARWLLHVSLGSCVLCALLGAVSLYRSAKAQHDLQQIQARMEPLTAESNQLTSSLANHKPNADLVADIARIERKIQQRQQALTMLEQESQRSTHGYAASLLALARRSKEGVWLTRVNLSSGRVLLEGNTTAADKIPAWMGGLQQESSFAGVPFEAFELALPVQDKDKPPVGNTPAYYHFVLKSQASSDLSATAGGKP